MTDRQIWNIYFHRRDERGRIGGNGKREAEESEEPSTRLPGPERVLTKEEEHAALFGLGRALGIPEEQLQAEWRKKYATD